MRTNLKVATAMTPEIGLTRALAQYASGSRYQALPAEVQHEAARAFVNWIGVAIGGCREEAVRIAASVLAEDCGRPQAAVIGQGLKTGVASAAFVNCIASSVLAYDDAHLSSVAHPSGPAASALFAVAQRQVVRGEDFLSALALAIEIQCRVANMLAQPPSSFSPSFYINGFSGPIGVAAGVGRLLGLDEQQMVWAIGIAASQASGFRATHGTMTAHFRPGHACRVGVEAALLAAKGFDCSEDALEARGGFLDVYARGADPATALAQLGVRHEMLQNRYKPYPCGIVIHPVIDACLDIRERLRPAASLAAVRLQVNPSVLSLTGKRAPRTPLESHVSVYHWAAAALVRGKAGLAETEPSAIENPEIAALRDRIEAHGAPDIGKATANVEVVLADGEVLRAHVLDARGSQARPMTDHDLGVKFTELAQRILPARAAEKLLDTCWRVGASPNVGAEIGALLP